jgi:pyruvate/2-oxoglutarate/acetoin dehydrogenase E1 component
VARTGALVIVEDSMPSHSMGGRMVDDLLPSVFGLLRAAPRRVTGAEVFMPVSKPLEAAAMLSDASIEEALRAAAPGR